MHEVTLSPSQKRHEERQAQGGVVVFVVAVLVVVVTVVAVVVVVVVVVVGQRPSPGAHPGTSFCDGHGFPLLLGLRLTMTLRSRPFSQAGVHTLRVYAQSTFLVVVVVVVAVVVVSVVVVVVVVVDVVVGHVQQ